MNETAVEAIILAINALGAGILLFVSGVAQRMMNELEPVEFKKFENALGRTAMMDPFAVAIATIPIFAVIYYFLAFGSKHTWFTAGIVVWMIGSSVTKVVNLPTYNWVGDAKNVDPEELKKKRHMLGLGNAWRAWLTLCSVILMACQFSIEGTVISVVAVTVVAYPSLAGVVRTRACDVEGRGAEAANGVSSLRPASR
jgi:hypothetical protein